MKRSKTTENGKADYQKNRTMSGPAKISLKNGLKKKDGKILSIFGI